MGPADPLAACSNCGKLLEASGSTVRCDACGTENRLAAVSPELKARIVEQRVEGQRRYLMADVIAASLGLAVGVAYLIAQQCSR